uniref:Pectinesterase inhibitor domain-containing protein n=1 Tax=Rhizophora mucronata TaxID=61149 RepID=A0A2P2QY89_RHIMU
MTWLSAALTNQDTCTEGLADVSGPVKYQMADKLRDLSELVSNCLAIFSASNDGDFSGVPIQNRRRLMDADKSGDYNPDADVFPSWQKEQKEKLEF